MTLTPFKFKIMRSKKTGRYFKFEQYYEDGFGEYHDSVTISKEYPLQEWDMPTIFRADFDPPKKHTMYPIKDHTLDEVEFVPVTITIETEGEE